MRRNHHHVPGLLCGVVLQESTESLEQRVEVVRSAIWSRNEASLNSEDRWYPVDVLEDAVIIRRGHQLYRASYSISEEGKVSFGETVAVKTEYRPLRMQEAVESAVYGLIEAESDDAPQGLEWDVIVIQPGLSKNGLYYPEEMLRESVSKFEDAHVYVFDDSATGHKLNPAEKTQGHMAGWIDGVRYQEGAGIVGRLHFLQEGVAAATRKKLVDAWKRGKTDLMGLSIDARGKSSPTKVQRRNARLVESIDRVLSVDVVLKPAAGGRFTRLVASAAADHQEEGMKTRVKRLLRILEARRPDALADVDQESVTFGELAEIATLEELRESLQEETAAPAQQSAPATTSVAIQEAERVATRGMVNVLLQESRLAPKVQDRVRKRFEGQIATEEQIQAAITEEREYAAALAPARVTVPGGGGQVSVGAEKLDRLQAAFDLSCGVLPEDESLRTLKPLGLAGLYREITLGHDPDVTGILSESAQQEMIQEAFTNATLDRVVANTLHRRLLKDYREVDYGERSIITIRPGVSDFKTQEAIRIGYFGDIPAVDPETADYAELGAYGDDGESYTVGQKGAIVSITRKHIKNDDVGHVAKVVGRLGRAARRTFAKFVWDMIISNRVMTDTKALFHVDHANLSTTAFSAAALNAIEQMLFKQTEPGSNERLGLTPFQLVIPIELKAAAFDLNARGTADNDNAWRGRFGPSGERIIVNPLFTDPDDYLVTANPADVDMIEVAFMDGNEEPELFVADNPTVGQMFTADKRQYKIRHEYGGAPVDFRGMAKAVVTAG